jgi:hypothetical protein
VAIGGAFQWELAGETHPMSKNDMFSTAIGGAALGETMYRFSSMLLDNQAKGTRRFFRESGAFLIDPVRGFNRFLSGRGGDIHPNPSDPLDWRPHNQENLAMAGVRFIGEGQSLSDNLDSHAYFELFHTQGDVFTNSRRGPFDYFDLDVQFNAGEKVVFWGGVFLLGLVVVGSGLVMDKLIPGLLYLRPDMQVTHMIHAIAAVLMIAMFLGHIYIGTIGMRGAYRAMRDGYVDDEWAAEHHEIWYDDIRDGRVPAQRTRHPEPPPQPLQT